MRRNGFTMVELIFIIVIIGVLATVALPKLGSSKDKAKINSELSSMEGLEGAITAAIEFQYQDYGDGAVNWHESSENSNIAGYATINTNKKVLEKIAKKNDGLRVVAFSNIDANGTSSSTDGMEYDIIFIEGKASNSQVGVKYPADAPNNDLAGKPDRNDFWAFNSSPVDINITGTNIDQKVVPAGELILIDVKGTNLINDYSSQTTVKRKYDGTPFTMTNVN